MFIVRHLIQSCRSLPQKWAQFADATFVRGVPDLHDELARGEFMSALISDSGLAFPAASRTGLRAN